MSITIYVVSAILVFVLSGLLAMAGLGAAFVAVRWFKVDILWVFIDGIVLWGGLLTLGLI